MKTINWVGKIYKVPEKYQSGYRLLQIGETFEFGDLLIREDGAIVQRTEITIGNTCDNLSFPTLRKIESKNKLKFRAGDRVKINGFPNTWPIGQIVQVLNKKNGEKSRNYLVEFPKQFVIKDQFSPKNYGYETQFSFNEQYLERVFLKKIVLI